ncbi:MAG: CpsD/CapB family tyrosine-protein kinase [Acidobacteria bacterium]|nr:CpsD/CapB family tyrosine-protein kinase [Acidobacteriota bacterium]
MGKVYEALERAERESQKPRVAALPLSNSRQSSATDRRDAAESFDFIDYSLKALPSEEVAQRHQEAASAAFARRSLVEPTHEAQLDLSRIDPHLTMFFDANQRASAPYNKLAISLIAAKDERPLKKILIASTHRAEGRTGVALNLACALARDKQKVLVIDADLHRPSLLRLLGLEAAAGLPEVIRQNLAPGQATVRVSPFNLEVLPTREQVENPTELFTAPRFREVLTLLEAEYDFILFDSSPLLQVNDANLLVRLTDATIFVIRAGKTSSLQLGKAVASLSEEHIFGVVLNRAEPWATA